MQQKEQEQRKKDHIDLTLKAQTNQTLVDERFFYEPLLAAHPTAESKLSTTLFGKTLNAPLWVSSMTGGVGPARHINQNLARACREFGLGMGLGSCRVLLTDKTYFEDFNLRPVLGDALPFFANLGIAQVEDLLNKNQYQKISDLVNSLDADGLIVHINPLQEWFQPEGDRYKFSPIVTLKKLCEVHKTKLIVKEVGQGMGPASLAALLDLPVDGIELASFGGTNFSKLEILRRSDSAYNKAEFATVGHTASEMIDFLNALVTKKAEYKSKDIIISGGIQSILDGHYLMEKLQMNSVVGQAKNFLVAASEYESLKTFVEKEIEGLKMARAFLVNKGD